MSAPATYAQLTSAAARRLCAAEARLRTAPHVPMDDALRAPSEAPRWHEVAVAHRDLSFALAHLGRVLAQPAAGATDQGRRRARRHGPEARLLRDLERRGAPRDWSVSPPEDGTAARDLWESARAIRAAADLWATHHTPAGAPRSPESSRMRHPSMLGAATREWRSLVHLAADTAETTLRQLGGAAADPAEEAAITTTEAVDVEHLRSYPRPRDLTASRPGPRPTTVARKAVPPVPPVPASQGAFPDTTVDVTVARPGRTAGSDPLVRAVDVVDRLRRAAWSLAELGEAPAPALAIFASVGVLLTDAAVTAVQAASERPDAGREVKASDQPDRDPLLARLLAQRSGWQEAAERISALRSPHPPTTILQAERLDLARQLDLLTGLRRESSIPAPRGSGPDGGRSGAAAGDTAQALATLADRYAHVALLNLRGLREAQERGDLYVRGEALPGDAVARRPDLLEAKLGRRLVPAPSAMVTPLVSIYRALGLSVSEPQAADGTSPAA